MRKTLIALMLAAALPTVAMAMPEGPGPMGGHEGHMMGGPGHGEHGPRGKGGPFSQLDLSKEQREQEQRRHESQMQQLQVELRQLQQTLIVKQDELTQLNRDNARLLTEARQLQKELYAQQQLLAQKIQALDETVASAATAASWWAPRACRRSTATPAARPTRQARPACRR